MGQAILRVLARGTRHVPEIPVMGASRGRGGDTRRREFARPRFAPSFLLLFLACSDPASACEPILPLVQVFFGTVFITGSLVVLGIIVAIKAAAFACFERRLPWCKAAVFMVIANLVSSLIGFCLALTPAVLPLILVGLPLVYFVSVVPGRRLAQFAPWRFLRKWNPAAIASLITLLYFATFVLFFLAQSVLDGEESLLLYWLLKFTYIYAALIISIGLTTIWEEWVVAGLARSALGGSSLLTPVLKANLLALFLAMFYAAVMMLPQRLRSADFLVWPG